MEYKFFFGKKKIDVICTQRVKYSLANVKCLKNIKHCFVYNCSPRVYVFTCSILVSIVVILTGTDHIIEKCVHLLVQYSQVLSQYL